MNKILGETRAAIRRATRLAKHTQRLNQTKTSQLKAHENFQKLRDDVCYPAETRLAS